MAGREFHDGATDGLEALEPLDPEKIHSFSELLEAMRKTAFGGRRLGEAYETLAAMIEDPDCKVVLTLSGAMTIAKMGKIISTMIDRGMVHAIVSTGALVAHGLSESVGKLHYRHDASHSDEELFQKGYNRVYDTLEMESNLNYVEHVVSLTLKRINSDQPLSSAPFDSGTRQDADGRVRRPRDSQERVSEKRAGVYSRIHRFRDGSRCGHMGNGQTHRSGSQPIQGGRGPCGLARSAPDLPGL